jgi:hypothetical protein
MRKLTLILTTLIFFSVMFSPSTSFAEWTKVSENVGATFYVDFERIRKHDGYVYYWQLSDYLKPIEYGILSGKIYIQGDCKKFRYKYLSASFHKGPMGGGIVNETSNTPDKDWNYHPPDSSGEIILKTVCQYAR